MTITPVDTLHAIPPLSVTVETFRKTGRVRAFVTVGDDAESHALDVIPTGIGASVNPSMSIGLKFALARRFRAAHGEAVPYPYREYMQATTRAVLGAVHARPCEW